MNTSKTLFAALFAAAAFTAAPAFADNDQNHYQQNRSQFISHEQAAQIAVKEVGGGTAEDVEFEHKHNGTDYFEVDVRRDQQEYEVKIDAKTGKVIKVKQDR